MSYYHEGVDENAFQDNLLAWYRENQRELPWRINQDPYRVWVSEVMLQQTRVETVIPYYERFMEWFPTPEDFAKAEEEKVMKAWEGLGYYSRVRNLHTAVKEVVESYGGKVPDNKKDFSSLKGVGPYTAGAVLSIAYEQPEPAVDGNVMRVLSRVLLVTDDISKGKTRKQFEEVIPTLMGGTPPSEFNQALMELGALVCTPKSPGCLLCPVQSQCEARKQGVQQELPVKGKKKAPALKEMAAIIIKDSKGKFLIHQRGSKGLLARLWEFPNTEAEATSSQKVDLETFLKEEYGVEAAAGDSVQNVQHVFSHLVWDITVYEGTLKNADEIKGNCKWVTMEEARKLAFPVSHQKILKTIEEEEA
ncbi:A/G-specific adenine glycosylase [Thalassorhabdus alkalitolerans]|uniref:Adenine DNA glycosylase n=1 Tax=Thalassorhabdus alkalitolerans TaxID=2282697 RepID=A0ABW0YLE5_9BACI